MYSFSFQRRTNGRLFITLNSEEYTYTKKWFGNWDMLTITTNHPNIRQLATQLLLLRVNSKHFNGVVVETEYSDGYYTYRYDNEWYTKVRARVEDTYSAWYDDDKLIRQWGVKDKTFVYTIPLDVAQVVVQQHLHGPTPKYVGQSQNPTPQLKITCLGLIHTFNFYDFLEIPQPQDLTADCTSGTAVFTVADATDFVVGKYMAIKKADGTFFNSIIASTTATTVTTTLNAPETFLTGSKLYPRVIYDHLLALVALNTTYITGSVIAQNLLPLNSTAVNNYDVLKEIAGMPDESLNKYYLTVDNAGQLIYALDNETPIHSMQTGKIVQLTAKPYSDHRDILPGYSYLSSPLVDVTGRLESGRLVLIDSIEYTHTELTPSEIGIETAFMEFLGGIV